MAKREDAERVYARRRAEASGEEAPPIAREQRPDPRSPAAWDKYVGEVYARRRDGREDEAA